MHLVYILPLCWPRGSAVSKSRIVFSLPRKWLLRSRVTRATQCAQPTLLGMKRTKPVINVVGTKPARFCLEQLQSASCSKSTFPRRCHDCTQPPSNQVVHPIQEIDIPPRTLRNPIQSAIARWSGGCRIAFAKSR